MELCGWCQQVIWKDDAATFHAHHDWDKCNWMPDPNVPEFEQMIGEVERHELTCPVVVYFHTHCCRKCSQDLAMS